MLIKKGKIFDLHRCISSSLTLRFTDTLWSRRRSGGHCLGRLARQNFPVLFLQSVDCDLTRSLSRTGSAQPQHVYIRHRFRRGDHLPPYLVYGGPVLVAAPRPSSTDAFTSLLSCAHLPLCTPFVCLDDPLRVISPLPTTNHHFRSSPL
jgi:hypothetical protein